MNLGQKPKKLASGSLDLAIEQQDRSLGLLILFIYVDASVIDPFPIGATTRKDSKAINRKMKGKRRRRAIKWEPKQEFGCWNKWP